MKIALLATVLIFALVGCDGKYSRLSQAAPGDTLYYRYGYTVTFGVVLHNIPKERVIVVNHRNIRDHRIVGEAWFSYDEIDLTSHGH